MTRANRLRCLLAAGVLSVWGFSAAAAQSGETSGTAPKNSLEKGAWALQFQVDSDAILTSFGGALAVKKHVSRQSAYRLGVDFGFDTDDSSFEETWFTQDTTSVSVEDDSNTEDIELFLHYLRYPSPDAPIHFFWGAGPFVRFIRNESTRRTTPRGYPDQVTSGEYVQKRWNAGVTGRLGVEWFATKTLSFHVEYSASAYVDRYTREDTQISSVYSVGESPNINTREQKSTGWVFNRGSTLFGLSAYF